MKKKKKDASYSVLFMRDDTDVKSFRVSPRRLRTLLWASGVLGVVLLVALVLGAHAFFGYSSLLAQKRALELTLADAQVERERSGNIEMMQKALGEKGGKAGDDKVQASPSGQSASSGQSGPAGRAFAKQNSGGIAVENVRVSLGGNAVHASFDLNNRAGEALSGEVHLLLLKTDGSLLELEWPAQELTFQIQRFKRIATSAKLPEGAARRDALGLRMEIMNSSGELLFGETFALGG